VRKTTSSLAALLSLLMVSAPVSSWACDFSCSSHQANSDCHNSVTASKDATSMSMPPGMDMGSDQGENAMGADAVMGATPGHSMLSMSPQQKMATERVDLSTNPEIRTGTIHDHSKSVSSCTLETCSQVTTSSSPPGADHSQPTSLDRLATSISSPASLLITFYLIRSGTLPPIVLTADRLVTSLRI